MIETLADTLPLAALSGDPASVIEQIKRTHRPITFTEDGRPGFVLQDAADYQRLLDLADQAEEDAAVLRGLEDMRAGRTKPLAQVFDELRARHGIQG